MDLAVRDAYGWTDLDLEHGWIETKTVEEKKDKKTGKVRNVTKSEWRFTISEKARREVLRRLLELNHQRYAEEAAAGLHDGKKGKRKAEEDDVGDEDAEAVTEPTTKRRQPASAAAQITETQQLGLFGAGPAKSEAAPAVPATKAAEARAPYDPAPSSPATTPATAARLSAAANAVLAALEPSGDGRSKAEILAASGIDPGAWNAAIAQLLAAGAVERQGEKRGTKYRRR